ncbi:hypothetical protein [Vibrio gallaecicus]|nr:hypothetical protein [Vibrio gallaecicus]MDN3613233.1 hypothetical protein [Vibrio gallaecicus]
MALYPDNGFSVLGTNWPLSESTSLSRSKKIRVLVIIRCNSP